MKEIPQKDLEKYKLKGNNDIRIALNKIEEGNGLLIERNEWSLKSPPNQYIHEMFPKKIFSVRKLFDDSGWLVIRKK